MDPYFIRAPSVRFVSSVAIRSGGSCLAASSPRLVRFRRELSAPRSLPTGADGSVLGAVIGAVAGALQIVSSRGPEPLARLRAAYGTVDALLDAPPEEDTLLFRQLQDPESSTYTYLLADERTREAVIIDPVLEQLERDLGLIAELGLELRYALDTHIHADHVTALGALRDRTGCKTVFSERAGAGCADVHAKEGDRIRFGDEELEVRETPGHTNACLTYIVRGRDMAFTGDTLLIRGCGRTDFQNGDARALYRSVHEKILSLPEHTLLYPAHDYKGRTVTTVAEEKRWNPRLGGGRSLDEFVGIMGALSLAYPKKMDIAVPANLHCGVPRGLSASGEPAQDVGWAPIEKSAAGVPEIAAEWVAAHPSAARVVDVRAPDEYDGDLGHVATAELVPLATLAEVAKDWDRDQPIITICRSGGRSARAASELAALGFRRVASMRGGMTAWCAARLPVERGPSSRTDARQDTCPPAEARS